MTSPKLEILARQLGKASAGTPAAGADISKMLTSYKEQVDREKEAAIKIADDRRIKVEADNAALVAQIAELTREASARQKELLYKLDSCKDVTKQEVAELTSRYRGELQAMQSQIDKLNMEVAKECSERVRAVTQLQATEKMCAHLKDEATKLANKPAVVAPAPKVPPRPLVKFRVTQRDENGNIVAFEQTA